MRGVNKVIVVGQLGADPDVTYTGSGTAIATLSIATEEQWTDKQTGEKQKEVSWHRVKMFGRLAEIAGEYLTKGKQVYIEGRLKYGKYTDKDGVERYTTDIIAGELQMLGGASGGHGNAGGAPRGGQRGNQTRDRQTNLDQRGAHNGGSSGNYGSRPSADHQQFDDEDIPF